ncbi:MAG: GGDEF domain-containing protein [Syntrophaceae bacterium]|mgnify:FL=1|jgi:diguanylate cyclase (GGDEF)-like protein|nr:GGDEF domain-containing protein [Syntrophaceae bacterium]
MKQVKANSQSSSFAPLTIESILKNIKTPAKAASEIKTPHSEFILIPAAHLSETQKSHLLSLGISIKRRDDVLLRLTQLESENRLLKSLSITDELTGLYNKRFFNRQLTIEIARTQRTGESFCLIFIDLDNFKTVNDTLGHTRGDEFLVKICAGFNHQVRPTDFACRFGGDEFSVILPATSLRDGIAIAERWHHFILQIADSMNMPVSSSIGVDEFNASCRLDAKEFLHQVDQLLYKAKKSGKGKVVHPDIDMPESHAVTWEEKKLLYHIFQPSASQSPSRKKGRGKN